MDLLRVYPLSFSNILKFCHESVTCEGLSVKKFPSKNICEQTPCDQPSGRSEMIPKLNMEVIITYVLPGQSYRVVAGLVKWWNVNGEN
jgi:hypothetical protein